jgi:AcrR family transcriptional regulator
MRKRPQQERSRQMVDTLIEATARVISQRGLDGATTPLIAEAAGVSVGSLYQYFEGKEALIEALVEKLADDVATALKRLPLSEDASLHELVAAAIHFGFAMLNSRDGLFLELVRNWHRLPTQMVADVLQQHFLELARVFFLKHYHDHPIENLQVRIFIIANSTLFTMVRLISQENLMIRQEAVAEGLITMIVGYLESGTRV